jgi:hypothetical protein
MENRSITKWDTFKIMVWFIAIVELFILFLAVINGYSCGYKQTFIAFGILGGLVGGALFFLLLFITGLNAVLGFIGKSAFFNLFCRRFLRRRNG